MLKVIEYGKDEYEFPSLLVLGCFDAIHIGHRELLKKAKLQAKINGLDLGVMMFVDGKSGKLVYSFEERLAILEQFNVKFVLAVDFNEEFKATAPLDFLHCVEDKINVKAYMSGKDFRFGAQAKGKSSTLKNYAEDEENGVWYMSVKDVDSNGEKVSTTLIKKYLDEGAVARANELLGSEFSVTGEVVKREGRGTSVVGFPTANIDYPEWKHPVKYGVYSVKCTIDDVEYNGVANFGTCPTFGDDRVALEVYFEDFSGDLYGRTLQIRFVDYIRDIEEFGNAGELSDQLKHDVDAANGVPQPVEAEAPAEEVAEEQPAEEEVVEEHPVEAQAPAEEVVEEQPAEAEAPAEEVVEEHPVEAQAPAEEVVEEQPAEAEAPAEEAVEDQPVEAEAPVEEIVEEQPIEVEAPAEEVVEEQPAPVEEVTEEQASEESESGESTDVAEDKVD